AGGCCAVALKTLTTKARVPFAYQSLIYTIRVLSFGSSFNANPSASASCSRKLRYFLRSSTTLWETTRLRLCRLSTSPIQRANLRERIDNLDSGSGSLRKRDLPVGTYVPGVPYTNGVCCSNTGVCSYAPSSCGANVCISNCDAKAPCGEYANPDNATCPLNVCCGSTDDFCGTGCQEGYGGCGVAPTPSCSSGSNSASVRRMGPRANGSDAHQFCFLFLRSVYFIALAYGLKCGLPLCTLHGTQDETARTVGVAISRRLSAPRQIAKPSSLHYTYGFDGVDTDWEYPTADDRGGVTADFSNFPTFLAELRASFGSGLGISTTLLSSYWYLQHFNVLEMEPSVDWTRATSSRVLPYIRPHTNLTEINDGLSLLWRAGVSPSKVVLGLGWYGRSFPLADPSYTTPNGVCQFTTGGTPGECTKSSGTLSNAEIKRLLAAGTGTESYDATAGVRWLTFDSNQWVSFDDGMTMQKKISFANSLCLGGIMIWSIDQDNTAGDSMNDLMGIGTANGVSEAAAASFNEQMANATLQNAVASSCYWSLCGGTYTTGYFDVTDARGQIAGFQQNTICALGDAQSLCCAPGTSMGTCQWEGFRGVGMPYSPACSDPDATIVARNTNSYQMNDGGQIEDLTCTGGYQAYCCTGFVPSSITNSGNLLLYGQTSVLSKRDGSNHGLSLYVGGHTVEKRGLPLLASELGALYLADAFPSALSAVFTFGLSIAAEGVICATAAIAGVATAAIIGFSILSSLIRWIFGGSPSKPNVGVPTTVAGRTAGDTSTSCDCEVTYTCRYNMGWDEIYDNQRWGINELLNGQTVYHPLAAGDRAIKRKQLQWKNQRKNSYRTAAQKRAGTGERPRCEVDEFPIGNLKESGNNAPQVCSLVNGPANGNQGNDYQKWKLAAFGPLPGSRGTGSGKHFIDAYGFDEQTAGSLCWATYTYTEQPGTISTSTPIDHGFRVLDDDPYVSLSQLY
ncbi:CAZyme family GH18, partial [Penicillium sp. IBT 16267x]